MIKFELYESGPVWVVKEHVESVYVDYKKKVVITMISGDQHITSEDIESVLEKLGSPI